jgi:hypothetical protein
MKLFSSTQISWNEPWFFPIRIRDAREWRIRLLLAIVVSIVIFLALFFFAAGRHGLPGMIGISLAAGFLVLVLLDIRHIQREVTVKEDGIIVDSGFGRGRLEPIKFAAIDALELIRPDEWDKPYGGMSFVSAQNYYLFAIPNKVSLDTLANILHRLGVNVSLSNWTPSDSDTRIGICTKIDLNPAAAQGEITIRPVEDQAGPLISPAETAVQAVIALGPLLLALIAAVVVAVVVFRNWTTLSGLEKGLYAGAAAVAVIATFLYMVVVGQFVAVAYAVRAARNKLQDRPNAVFSGTEHDLVAVQIYDRKSWTATIAKSSDYGFLRIDRQHAKLLFEGNKFRWTLPIAALTACRIEESIVGSEGNPNPQKRYFVVINAPKDGQTWEAGMIYTRTEIGNDTAEARYKRAQLLFAQLAEGVTPGKSVS